MFPRAFRIARISGIDVKIDPTWIFIALLVVWTFYSRFAEGRGSGMAVGMAVAGTLLFFGSVLAHELAHALEAKHRGVEVRGITLFLFGGVTEMHLEAERPFDEFAISAVGPYTSLVAAALFGITATIATALGYEIVGEVAGLLGWVNVVLAFFNLVPGAPLDGGRVLRSIVWAVTDNRHRAVRVASYAGQGVAILLWLLGVRAVLTSPAGVFNALWWWFIGWFLWQAAVSERRQAETELLLEGRTVASLSPTAPPRLHQDRPLSIIADQIAASPGFDIYPVVAPDDEDAPSDGRIVGALHLPDVLEMDPTDRNFRTAGEVMRPIDHIPSIPASEDLKVLLRRINDEQVLKVVDADGRVQSLLSRRQVVAALDRLHALAQEQHGRRRGVGMGS
ncbi:MAG: site-2 protease family protein [Nitriliruptorales bacterium]|nr:site-2 protease family protein [Nitriliruptorales bacterium]